MKHWLGRTPRTVGDWLGLALGTALIFGGVAQLPALAAALGRLAVMLRAVFVGAGAGLRGWTSPPDGWRPSGLAGGAGPERR